MRRVAPFGSMQRKAFAMTMIQPTDRAARLTNLYTSALALLAWAALILQLYLTIRQSQARGVGAAAAAWLYFAFFTVLTNILAALTLTWPLVRPRSAAGRFFARADVVTAVAANIILVGISYNLLLRNAWNPQGLQLLADVLLHDVLPAAVVVYWWLIASRSAHRYADIARWAVYPAVYFVYALLRGAGSGFYAYPFIDVTQLGYVRVLGNGLGILAGFVVIAAILIAIGRARARRRGGAVD
jgi:hypothetical protein